MRVLIRLSKENWELKKYTNISVATGRFKKIDATTIQPGRIAILKDYRKRGLGELVVKALENLARQVHCTEPVIHGDFTAAPFYEKLGYRRDLKVYLEDGIQYVTLRKTF